MAARQSLGAGRHRESLRKREAILNAAGACFAESGYRGATANQIAQRAGVSKGLVFHFFGDKASLYDRVVEDCLEQWSSLSEFRASEGAGSTLEELRQLFLASFDFIEQYPALSLFSREDEGMLAAYRKDFRRKNTNWRRRIQRTLQHGVKQGDIRDDVATDKVAVIFHQLQVALLRTGGNPAGESKTDRATTRLAIDLLLDGLKPDT